MVVKDIELEQLTKDWMEAYETSFIDGPTFSTVKIREGKEKSGRNTKKTR